MTTPRLGAVSFLLTLALSLAPAVLAAQPDRIQGPIEGDRAVVLKGALMGMIHPGARPEDDRGALDPATRIHGVKLVLGQTDEEAADLERLIEAQRNPASPDFQNWLSPEEYGARFGLSANDLGRIASWLESQGFAIEQVARAGNWITFGANAGQIAATFRAELDRYEAGGEKHFANASEPSIPASLAGIVIAIRGLDDFHPKPQRVSNGLQPDFNATDGSHYLAPADLAAIYDIQALYAAGFDGTGQKLAIAGQTDVNIADLRAFRAKFSLPAKDPQMVLAGADPGVSAGDQIEADLDLEWSGAIARGATIVYVYSPDVLESLQYAIDQNLAPVISMSYGGCEVGSPGSVRTLAQQANAQGITWMNAAGDSGAAGCDASSETIAIHGPSVTFPADLPEVTAVGGTEFNEGNGAFWSNQNGAGFGSAISYIPEIAWNDTALGHGLASGGGGASAVFTKPAWQTGPGVPNDGARDVPDVSLAASGAHDSYLIYVNGGLMALGGTSVASPSFAGIAAILNQYLRSKGGSAKPGLGNMNPALYALAQNTPGIFHDVIGGNNIVPCAAGVTGCVSGSYGYKAGPGYDLATGLGSVDAYNLVTRWTALTPGVSTNLGLSASPAGISQTGTTRLTATVSAVTGTSTPAGTITFTSGSVTLGSAPVAGSGATASAGLSVKGNALDAGVNTITAAYTGSAGFGSSTATATVTVTAPAPVATTITVTANPVSIAPAGSTVLTATVRPASGSAAPTGTVAFAAGNTLLGTATLAASGSGAIATLTVKGTNLVAGANRIVASYAEVGNFGASATAPVTVTVASPAIATATMTTTTVSVDRPTVAESGTVSVTALVKPASGNAAPTGTVTFSSGNTSFGAVPLSSGGSTAGVTLPIKAAYLATGPNTITVVYSGAYSGVPGFAGSSGAVRVTVNPPDPSVAATQMSLGASPANIAATASVRLTATLTAFTGSVSFTAGSVVLGSAPVLAQGNYGIAFLTVKGSSLAAGANTIKATYTAKGNVGSAMANVIVTVTPIAQSASTQLTVTVKAATGNNSPGGTVTLAAAKTSLGSAVLAGTGGTATATLTLRGNGLLREQYHHRSLRGR